MHTHRHTARWPRKFVNALRGIALGIRGQSSFLVHLPAAAAVLGFAAILQLDVIRFSILWLCIGAVISAELFNTSLEHLARSFTRDDNPEIRDALDIASGAVLCIAISCAVVGVAVLVLGR